MVKRPQQTQSDKKDEQVIKAIASSDRRRIIDSLSDAPKTTGGLCQELPWLNRCTVMQHLKVLENAGLIITKKQGRERWNYLDISPIQHFHQRWISPYAIPSADLLLKLKQNLEAQ